MPPFARSLRQAQILILEIFIIFLRLKFSPSLISNKIEHFEIGSFIDVYRGKRFARNPLPFFLFHGWDL